MNMVKFKKKTKTGKRGESTHQVAVEGSSYMRGISPTSRGALSSFYSTGPVLSLKPIVQAKLTIGQPNDRYEQEADRVADQVMRMPESKGSLVQRQSSCSECPEKEDIRTKPIADRITPLVQRQAEEEEEEEVQAKLVDASQLQLQEEEEEEEEEPVQAKQLPNKSPSVSAGLQRKIQSVKGGGEPLPNSVRSYFEPRFGTDFSQVRVHAGSQAAKTADSINAKAFTTGKDMVFGAGQYSPQTSPGRRLLAHELTHVIQQKFNNNMPFCQRKPNLMDYIVQGGDTLSGIGKKFGVSYQKIMKINNLTKTNIKPGQKLKVPAKKGCSITVPSGSKKQLLSGLIYAEALAKRSKDDEREAIGWALVNSVDHTKKLCSGAICKKLKKRKRKSQCRREKRDLGNTLLKAIKIGSTAYNGGRWKKVMAKNKMLPPGNLCILKSAERTALKRSIRAAKTVAAGQNKKSDVMRFNQAANSPPSKRFVKDVKVGVHTFYKFKSGRKCG